MNDVTYCIGDATEYRGDADALQVIAHCVNDIGKWGRGFVIPLGERYPVAKLTYKQWAAGSLADVLTDEVPGGWTGTVCHKGEKRRVWASAKTCSLGHVLLVESVSEFEPKMVAHIVGQEGIRSAWNMKPIRYAAMAKGFDYMVDLIKAGPHQWRQHQVQAPKLGSGLSGGNWPTVEAILKRNVVGRGIPVTVFDLQ